MKKIHLAKEGNSTLYIKIMKNLIPYLSKAVANPKYNLYLEFEDGTKGTIDLSKWVGKGVFEYWNDEKKFISLKITTDKKLQWNENIDMDPDAFYLQLIGKTFDEYAGNKQLLRDSH